MEVAIEHAIVYRYDRPVFIEPHLVRLRPRCDPWQQVRDWRLDVVPREASQCHCLDYCGNAATQLWFDDLHTELRLTSQATVVSLPRNPFDFVVVYEDSHRIPTQYPEEQRSSLGPFLATDFLQRGPFNDWVLEIRQASGDETLRYVSTLTQRIHGDLERQVRLHGSSWSPEQTLSEGGGACRDLAVLFVHSCRAVGIAARFVSGYCVPDSPDAEPPELHAWAEVYLPGGGWRGFDPSHGIAATEYHLPLASGPEPADAAVCQGTFRGTEAQSSLDYRLSIRVL